MRKILQFYLGAFFPKQKLKKEKKRGPAGQAGAEAGPKPGSSGGVPARLLPRGRGQAGPFGHLPGPAASPAGPRPDARPGLLVSLRCFFSLDSVLSRPGRGTGCPQAGHSAAVFVPVFLPQRLLFGATYKRGFFPIFCVDLIPCSLSSIANILRARFPLIPPMILAQI